MTPTMKVAVLHAPPSLLLISFRLDPVRLNRGHYSHLGSV